MSTRNRAGRKAYETKLNNFATIKNFAAAMAEKRWKFDSATTKAMIITRTAKETGKTEVITFSQAYAELSGWADRAFVNTSENGLSDMLAETFFQGAIVHTPKAAYQLWVKPEAKEAAAAAETLMINLNDRQEEFQAALKRAAASDLEVYADFERDAFVVVNHSNSHEYRVELKPVGGKALISCTCEDFKRRNRICKHQSAVLQDSLCDILSRFSAAAA